MPYEIKLVNLPFVAGEDMSTKKYAAVALSNPGVVVTATSGADPIIGILQNDPKLHEHASVCVFGVSIGIAGESIPVGTLVTAGAGGKVVAASPGDRILGIALENAVADAEVAILVTVGGIMAAGASS